MTIPQDSLSPSPLNFMLQSQLDPSSALIQEQQAQAIALANMNGLMPLMPQTIDASMSQPTSVGSVLTPDVLKRYIAKEGIGSPAQAAQIALLAWQNGDVAVAQFAAKIATNYSLSKLIAGQDGDANSISWTDLGKLAKGKPAIGREDIGAAPDLTEALESDLRAMAGLAPGASQQNQWDPYGTMSGVEGAYPQQQPYPNGAIPVQPSYLNGMASQPSIQGQPVTLNGVNGNVVMVPYEQALQLQQTQQGQILQPQQVANLTPLEQSMKLAGVGGNFSPLMEQAGLSAPGYYPPQQQGVAIPAAISQPISSGYMMPQQPPTVGQGYYPQQPILPAYPQQQGIYGQSQYPQQPMASMPITLPGSYRLALMPSY